jgi:molybdopterin molybdotransferase
MTSVAGTLPRRALGPGQAARIFTGAPVPDGADAVVRQEAAAIDATSARVFVTVEPGANIRRRGEEIQQGADLFAVGQRLDPYALGVLASIGVAEVAVFPPPRVALITIGDELVRPGRPAGPEQIFDSNSVMLHAQLALLGVTAVSSERVADEDGAIHSALQRAVHSAELVITCGGASVGDRDRIKKVLAADGGTLAFDGLAMKPGKPASFGSLEGTPVVILPGNPGAAAVAFDQLARPAILKHQGVIETRQVADVRLGSGQKKQAGLTYLLAAKRHVREDGQLWAEIRPQGAGQLFQNVGADGWVVLPPGRGEFFAGEVAQMELFACASTRPA